MGAMSGSPSWMSGRLGGGAAHVEGEEIGVPDRAPDQRAAPARPRPGPDSRNRIGSRSAVSGAVSPRRTDEVEAPAKAPFAQDPVEPADVGRHQRLHVGVGGGGRGALVFVDLRVRVARDGHRQVRELGLREIADRAFVDRGSCRRAGSRPRAPPRRRRPARGSRAAPLPGRRLPSTVPSRLTRSAISRPVAPRGQGCGGRSGTDRGCRSAAPCPSPGCPGSRGW